MGEFEIFSDVSGQYRWRLRAANGEIVAASEGYVNKAGAENGIRAVKASAQDATVVDLT